MKKKAYVAWKKSGKSKIAFCKERGLGYHSFVKDCNLFAEESGAGFSRIELSSPSTIRERIEIHERDGRRLFLPIDTPEHIIRMFVKRYARLK